MGGIDERNSKLGKLFLPKNARRFDDYSAYIAEQGTLWAWSKKGISQKEFRRYLIMEVLFISINRFVRYWNTDTCCIDDYSN